MKAEENKEPLGPEDVRQALIEGGTRLSADAREQVLALGAEATGPLLEVIEDRELWDEGSPGDGWAPIHAAKLLGEIHPPEALEPMLRAQADADPSSSLSATLDEALAEFGAALVEPALAAIAGSDDEDFRLSLSTSLAKCGVEDERIYQQLLAVLRDNNEIGPGLLADYGDPRALEPLGRALDDYVIEEGDSPLINHAVIELEAAITELGGKLTPAQREKMMLATESQRRWREKLQELVSGAAAPARRLDRPGRNDPCWCGSGKKYKRCHLRSDEDQT